MSKEKAGRLFTIERSEDDGATWTRFGGLRTKSFGVSKEQVDLTNDDDVSGFRRYAPFGVTRELTLTGSGRFQAAADFRAARKSCVEDEELLLRFTAPGEFTVQGQFFVQQFDLDASYDDAANMNITYLPSGEPTWTDLDLT